MFWKVRQNSEFDLLSPIQRDQQWLIRLGASSPLPMSISDASSVSTSEQSSGMLDGSFLWFQLFIETLLKMQHTEDDRLKLVQFFRDIYQGDSRQLRIMDEFEERYSARDAL